MRLKDAIERSESNPGRSLGDSDIIKTLPERQFNFLIDLSSFP